MHCSGRYNDLAPCEMTLSWVRVLCLIVLLTCCMRAGPADFYAISIEPPTTNSHFDNVSATMPPPEVQRLSIGQFIRELPRRNVYLKAEETTVENNAHTVEAGLTLGDAAILFVEMNGPGKLRVIDSIPVAPQMAATLSGDGFAFPSHSNERQFVDPSRPCVWRWQVVPTKTGLLRLILRVSVVVTTDGVNVESEYQVKEQPITVVVGWKGRIELALDWTWAVLKFILVPLGGLTATRIWRHRRATWRGLARIWKRVTNRRKVRPRRRHTAAAGTRSDRGTPL